MSVFAGADATAVSVDDVATVMECAPGTVKASLHAARQSLAARLGADEAT